MKNIWLATAIAAIVLACGSTTEPAGISVGGTYATAVALTSNTCGSVDVQPMPTTVTHATGATTLTVTHAGNSYSGTLASDGSFTTTPRAISANGSTFTIALTGRFTTSGFEADVGVDVQQPTAPTTCRYVVHWIGTRTSGTNTLP
jgi:hypothetical protein